MTGKSDRVKNTCGRIVFVVIFDKNRHDSMYFNSLVYGLTINGFVIVLVTVVIHDLNRFTLVKIMFRNSLPKQNRIVPAMEKKQILCVTKCTFSIAVLLLTVNNCLYGVNVLCM